MNIFPTIQGSIIDYDIIVVGHLRFNRYFGESDNPAPRGHPSTCTSTLIRGVETIGKPYALLVDPTLRLSANDYYFDLNRRTGLRPEHITHCFTTHIHGDHVDGLAYFPNAQWLAPEPMLPELRAYANLDCSSVQGVSGEFLPGVYSVPLPGHTLALHGIAFIVSDKRYLVASDSLMTKHHLRHNTCEFEKDAAMATRTILDIKESFDYAIPGHDNIEPI